jgi:hypothetical protein
MNLKNLSMNLGYVFEMVPTHVRIVSDDDANITDDGIIVLNLHDAGDDSITRLVMEKVLSVTSKPKEIVLIDMCKQGGGTIVKFVVN